MSVVLTERENHKFIFLGGEGRKRARRICKGNAWREPTT